MLPLATRILLPNLVIWQDAPYPQKHLILQYHFDPYTRYEAFRDIYDCSVYRKILDTPYG